MKLSHLHESERGDLAAQRRARAIALANQGLTNRDIGTDLGVSRKMVSILLRGAKIEPEMQQLRQERARAQKSQSISGKVKERWDSDPEWRALRSSAVSQRDEIIRLANQGMLRSEIAAHLGLARYSVNRMLAGVELSPEGQQAAAERLSQVRSAAGKQNAYGPEIAKQVAELAGQGLLNVDIENELGLGQHYVAKIVAGLELPAEAEEQRDAERRRRFGTTARALWARPGFRESHLERMKRYWEEAGGFYEWLNSFDTDRAISIVVAVVKNIKTTKKLSNHEAHGIMLKMLERAGLLS